MLRSISLVVAALLAAPVVSAQAPAASAPAAPAGSLSAELDDVRAKQAEFNEVVSELEVEQKRFAELHAQAQRAEQMRFVALVGAGLLVAGGIIFMLRRRSERREPQPNEHKSEGRPSAPPPSSA
jgi:flagellar biosynthesis/type III secretory pathway M-ring protein FliF/YscJ